MCTKFSYVLIKLNNVQIVEGETICGIVGTALKQKMELFELPPYKKNGILEWLGQILTSGSPSQIVQYN